MASLRRLVGFAAAVTGTEPTALRHVRVGDLLLTGRALDEAADEYRAALEMTGWREPVLAAAAAAAAEEEDEEEKEERRADAGKTPSVATPADDVDDVTWRALHGLSRSFSHRRSVGRKDEDEDEGRRLLRAAIAAVPRDAATGRPRERRHGQVAAQLQTDLALSVMYDRAAHKNAAAGGPAAAFAAAAPIARRAYADDPSGDRAVRAAYVAAMYGARDYAAVEALARAHFAGRAPPGGRDYLAALLGLVMLARDEVGRSLTATGAAGELCFGGPPGVVIVGDDVADRVDFARAPWVAAWLAEFCFAYHPASAAPAVALWERILEPAFRAAVRDGFRGALVAATASALGRLGGAYFRCAVEEDAAAAAAGGRDPAGVRRWVDKMRRIPTARRLAREEEQQRMRDEDGGGDGPAYPPGLVRLLEVDTDVLRVAACLRLHAADAEAAEWRPPLARAVGACLDVLADAAAAPFHAHAWAILALTLLGAADAANGVAALCVLVDDPGDPDRTAALEAVGWRPDMVECDGLCRAEGRIYRFDIGPEASVCVGGCWPPPALCRDCYADWASGDGSGGGGGGGLPIRRLCMPGHEFVRFKPVPPEAKDVAAVLDGGRLVPRKEWLDALRAEWAD